MARSSSALHSYLCFYIHMGDVPSQESSLRFLREYSEVSTIEARLPEDLEILRLWMAWEIEPRPALSVALLGKLHELNASSLPFI